MSDFPSTAFAHEPQPQEDDLMLSPMPRLADLDYDTSPYPARVGIFCDQCGTERVADYFVAADSTREDRLEVARDYLRGAEGWSCGADGDFCPACRPGDDPDQAHDDGQI